MHMFTKSIICLPPKVNCEIGGAVRNLPGAVRKRKQVKKNIPLHVLVQNPSPHEPQVKLIYV